MPPQDASVTYEEIPATLRPSPEVSDDFLIKLLEYGGFVAAMLVLCLFFAVLTRFVKVIKGD